MKNNYSRQQTVPQQNSRYIGDEHAGRFTAGTEPIPITVTDQHPDRVMTTLSPCHGALFEIIICRSTTDTIVFSAAHLLTDARGLLIITAYGTALRDWLSEFAGVTLERIPLCSTADLRRYFPEDRRSYPMNYTVTYWSPIHCGRTFLETITNTVRMSQESKADAISIGAAEPFREFPLNDGDIGKFA